MFEATDDLISVSLRHAALSESDGPRTWGPGQDARPPSSSYLISSCLSALVARSRGCQTFKTKKMHPLTAYAVGVAVVGFLVYALVDVVSKYNAKYNCRGLPGPALIPWVGRIHDLPIDFMWLKFKEWADIYGPIYRTKMLGANFVIISDESIAEDILVKRAKVYSDRPEIKSLFDAKSTYGSMEYLPLMGKNRKSNLRIDADLL